MHLAYPGQVATSRNFAITYAPFDIPMGRLYEFCIYHLMPVTDPTEMFHQQAIELRGTNGNNEPTSIVPQAASAMVTEKKTIAAEGKVNVPLAGPVLLPRPAPGLQYLGEVASVIQLEECWTVRADIRCYVRQTTNIYPGQIIRNIIHLDGCEFVRDSGSGCNRSSLVGSCTGFQGHH